MPSLYEVIFLNRSVTAGTCELASSWRLSSVAGSSKSALLLWLPHVSLGSSVSGDQTKRQIRSVCDCVVEKKAHSRRINSMTVALARLLIVCAALLSIQRLAITLKLLLLLPFSMGSDLLRVHEWMPCHNGGKLEHAGQSGHLIPAVKPSQAERGRKRRSTSNSGSS